MSHITSRRVPRLIGLGMTLIAMVAALGLPASAFAVAVETNTQSVSSLANQIAGSATSASGGVAVPGAAVAVNVPVVVQGNIQVDTTGNPNNLQTATNDTTVDQATAAVSGDPTATNGGTATTGPATSISTAVVVQMNLQVITGLTPAGGVTQTAGNEADLGQTTVSATGSASADGGGSTAVSGGATTTSAANVLQVNTQIYGGGGSNTSGAVAQGALNAAGLDQTIAAATGTATATGGGSATTGSAANSAASNVSQSTTLTVDE